ncbi:MAG: mismatch-specific DNA-glycosylase [Candidatus Sericytochromatia bacterium]
MAHQTTLDGYLTLDDIIEDGLDVLFCGYNPNPLAVESRHYYARKANRFWEDLHEAGFVPRVLRGPGEDLEILRYGLGLTDAIKRPTPTIDGLTAADFRAGFARLHGLLERHRPRVLCFNGLGLLERFQRFGGALEGVTVLAVPSTSPRNNGRKAERLAAFREVRALVVAQGGGTRFSS